MLKAERRVLTLPEALCSVLSGEAVPELYKIDSTVAGSDTKWEAGVRPMMYRVSRKTRTRSSPLAPFQALPAVPHSAPPPSKKPSDMPLSEWLVDQMQNKRCVMAAVPVDSTCVALSKSVACGSAEYWLQNLIDNANLFNEEKTHSFHSDNRTFFEANMLFEGVPSFLPEGNAYGLRIAELDSCLDAGLRVEVRKRPYAAVEEPVVFKEYNKQMSLCAKEMSFLLDMAKKGIAPCVVAAFYTYPTVSDVGSVDMGALPMAQAPVDYQKTTENGEVTALVVITQISTFNLGSIMTAIRNAPVEAKRDHLVGVLHSVCPSIFSVIRYMITPSDGYSVVKLNMTPDSIVFCPKLVASGNNWTLEGNGFMPVSQDFIDGVPKMTDFNAVFNTRVREASFSTETSFVMHSLILVAFARAKYGPVASGVMWSHLLSEDDPSGFVKAAKRMQSKQTNASAFLACLAANSDMRENPDLSKAMAELVSDMDFAVREGVIGSDGKLCVYTERQMFGKLVSVVSGAAFPDTHLFDTHVSDSEYSELAHVRALEAVKQSRRDRLARLTHTT